MYTELFQQLGLSLNEAKMYESLVFYGGSAITTVAMRAKVNRSNAYDAIHRLIDKGLVYEIHIDRDVGYEAVDPEKLLEFVKEKEQALSRVLPDLIKAHRVKIAPQRAYIYKGIEGLKNCLRLALRERKDIYSFAGKGAWFDPRLDLFRQHFFKEAKKAGIEYYHIFDHEVRTVMPLVHKSYKKQTNKFLPQGYSTDSAFDVFGDYIVTFTGLGLGKLEDDVTFFIITSPRLASAYRTWWKFMWDSLPPEK